MNSRTSLGKRIAIAIKATLFILTTCPVPNVIGADESGLGVHVRNPATPTQGLEVLATRELWRSGAGEDSPLFGVILQAMRDENGLIYLLDGQQNTVFVFNSEGEFLKTIAREGDGPGEIRRPSGMTMLSDGAIGISKAHSNQLVRLDRDGIPLKNIQARSPEDNVGMIWLEGAGFGGGKLVLLCHNMSHENGKQKTLYYLAGFDPSGTELCRYFSKEIVDDFSDFRINEMENYFPKGRLWTVGPDGKLYLAPDRNEYRVNVYVPDCGLEMVIERDFIPVSRDPKEKSATRRAYEDWYGSLAPKIELEDVEPAVLGVMADPEGFLWVLSSRGIEGQPEGVLATYDVFDEEGDFIKQVAVTGGGDGRQDDLFFLGGKRLLLITRALEARMAAEGIPLTFDTEPAPMEIVYLEIVD